MDMLKKAFRPLLQRLLIAFLLLSQAFLTLPGCGGAVVEEETDDDPGLVQWKDGPDFSVTDDGKGGSTNLIGIALNMFSQYVNIGTTLSFFGVPFDFGQGLPTFAMLSDDTINDIANKVGGNVTAILASRDKADAAGFWNASTRGFAHPSSQTPKSALDGIRASANNLSMWGEKLLAQLTNRDNSTETHMALGQHIVSVGMLLSSFYRIQAEIYGKTGAPALKDSFLNSSKAVDRDLVKQVKKLEQEVANYPQDSKWAVIVPRFNGTNNTTNTWKGCVTGPGIRNTVMCGSTPCECGSKASTSIFPTYSPYSKSELLNEAQQILIQRKTNARIAMRTTVLSASISGTRTALGMPRSVDPVLLVTARVAGGAGGNAFDDVTFLASQVRQSNSILPTGVRVSHDGSTIYNYQFKYGSAYGPMHGGSGGSQVEVGFAKGATISSIVAYTCGTGDYQTVCGLKVVMSSGSYYLFGNTSGSAQVSVSASGSTVVGAYGRSGARIDAIGLIVASSSTVSPPTTATGGPPWLQQ